MKHDTIWQDYQVLDLLGKGGFASVYRARCLRTGMEVAIKMVSNGCGTHSLEGRELPVEYFLLLLKPELCIIGSVLLIISF